MKIDFISHLIKVFDVCDHEFLDQTKTSWQKQPRIYVLTTHTKAVAGIYLPEAKGVNSL